MATQARHMHVGGSRKRHVYVRRQPSQARPRGKGRSEEGHTGLSEPARRTLGRLSVLLSAGPLIRQPRRGCPPGFWLASWPGRVFSSPQSTPSHRVTRLA